MLRESKQTPVDENNGFLKHCIRALKRMNAPLSGWVCIQITDVRDDDEDAPLATCELCGCQKVRYVHYMKHPAWVGKLGVGCICAGIMQGDLEEAEEQERLMKNRAKRRKRFVKGKWVRTSVNKYFRRYKRQDVTVIFCNGVYYVYAGDKETNQYKGKPITNILSASYAAFDLLDPVEALLA